MMKFLRQVFGRITIEETRLADLEDAEFNLLNACKQVEYYQAIAASSRQTIARLKPVVRADDAGAAS